MGVGPKAESLRRMADAGLPVPEARFLDAAEYRAHVARAGVDAHMAGAGAGALDAAAVRAAIEREPVDDGLAAMIRGWCDELGGGTMAVRSSANVEDLPGASFAGQHGTYFAQGGDQVVRRVRDCWASLYSERAVSYRERAGIAHADAEMGVIVQRLVPAVAAGVAFTADPVSGAPGVWVESCHGIGEALVSGKVSPDRFVFEPETLELREAEAGKKPVCIEPDLDGTVSESHLDPVRAGAFSIAADTAHDVAILARRAAELLGSPADVEWAYDGERVWLLQARPVTGAPVRRGPLAIWSNVNTGEILPDVVTPMTWSFIHDNADVIFGGMFGALGVRLDAQELIGLVGGRVYFNLAIIREAFKHLPGFDVDTMLGGLHNSVEIPADAELPPSVHGSRSRALVSLPRYVLQHTPRRARDFLVGAARETDEALASIRSEPGLDDAYKTARSQIDRFSRLDDSLAFMAVAMLGFAALSGVCRAWLADTTGALANRLVSGRGDVASAMAGHALWALAEEARTDHVAGPIVEGDASWSEVREALERARATAFLRSWDSFMSTYGHHRRGELEVANPGWAERPDYVLGIVRDYLARGAADDPMARYAERAAEAERAADDCRRRLANPVKRAAFERVLGWGRMSSSARENMKNEAVRWLECVRQALLLVGRRLVERGDLEDAEDVFFVSHQELEVLVSGTGSGWKSLVASRRAEHARLSAITPPPVVVGEWDGRPAGAGAIPSSGVLHGISVSAGVVRGPARVFERVDSHAAVLPGEILVAPFTDPGWTPYFVPAAGIVMDMGGLLSHGSIIAREYGIPAVVNVGPATRIIRDGQLIEVDGDAGEVRILE